MASVQSKSQEPSMEEILASIRRIIADDRPSETEAGEPAEAAGGADDVLDLIGVPEIKRVAEPPPVEPVIPPERLQAATAPRGTGSRTPAQAAITSGPETLPAESPAAQPSLRRPLSPERPGHEIAAPDVSAREASAREAIAPETSEPEVRPSSRLAASPASAARLRDQEDALDHEIEFREVESGFEADPEPTPEPVQPAPSIRLTRPDRLRPTVAPVAAPPPPAPPSAMASVTSPSEAVPHPVVHAQAMPASDQLISATSQAAVSSAFHSLANTVLSHNPRTLESLVEDMLRPMLKSWLDTHLPPMVERMVQAEIERISKGRQ